MHVCANQTWANMHINIAHKRKLNAIKGAATRSGSSAIAALRLLPFLAERQN